MPKVGLIYGYDNGLLIHELRKQSANPQALLIERRIAIAHVGLVLVTILEMELALKDLGERPYVWHFYGWQDSLEMHMQSLEFQAIDALPFQVC